MKKPNQAVFLCGGLGTRLKPITEKVPKPMALVNNKPFLLYLIEQLKNEGIQNFLLLTGYKSSIIEDYFKDGSQFDVSIKYHHGPVSWDTGHRILMAKDFIEDTFILMYSDNYSPFSLEKSWQRINSTSTNLCLQIHRKEIGNIRLKDDKYVECYDQERSSQGLNFVEVGYIVADKSVLLNEIKPYSSLTESIKNITNKGKSSYIYCQSKYQSISDLIRLKETEKHLQSKKIILIDRDGTINKRAAKMDYIKNWDDFEFIEDSVIAMEKLSNLGFKFIVITNQAGVSRGIIDINTLNDIHQKMVSNLSKRNINIIDIFFCPHHWDSNCLCRKPMPGMLLKASKKYNFNLSRSIYIGDDIRDVEAAYNAFSKSILLTDNYSEVNELKIKPDLYSYSLNKLIPNIVKLYNGW